MPAYITHAIMGEQIHNEGIKEENLFKIPISKEELKGFSLGNDLSIISRRLKIDPQNNFTKEFFLDMIKYIKENKLTEEENIMSLLYGHIAHYFLDINCHPLIYYIEGGCQKVGLIPSHDLIEGYLSSYISTKVLKKDIMEINASYFNQIDLSNPETSKLLNIIYGKNYGDYRIVKTYKYVLRLFSTLETIVKSKVFSKLKLIKLSGFHTFLDSNNLTPSEITNENHDIYQNPVTGEIHRESFLELYFKAIDMTLDAIKEVNKYLYSQNISLSSLEKTFMDISYDAGVECSLGRKFIYTRKKQITK